MCTPAGDSVGVHTEECVLDKYFMALNKLLTQFYVTEIKLSIEPLSRAISHTIEMKIIDLQERKFAPTTSVRFYAPF